MLCLIWLHAKIISQSAEIMTEERERRQYNRMDESVDICRPNTDRGGGIVAKSSIIKWLLDNHQSKGTEGLNTTV